jgi:hypothetical protein
LLAYQYLNGHDLRQRDAPAADMQHSMLVYVRHLDVQQNGSDKLHRHRKLANWPADHANKPRIVSVRHDLERDSVFPALSRSGHYFERGQG